MKHKTYFITAFLIIFSSLCMGNHESFAIKELNVSTPELARSSADIVVAKCISTEARIDEKTGLIFTYTTFDVDESLKGTYGDEIVLRIVGGTIGDRTVSSPFLPSFKAEEEVVLFIGPKNSDGYPLLQSVQRGVYRVSSDDTGAKYIANPAGDLPLFNAGTSQRMKGNGKVSLDDFIYSINEIL